MPPACHPPAKARSSTPSPAPATISQMPCSRQRGTHRLGGTGFDRFPKSWPRCRIGSSPGASFERLTMGKLTNEKRDATLLESNRFDILKALREGMLSEMQEFRGAMWKATLAAHAVVVAVVSWLFTKGVVIGTTQKVLLSVGVTAFLGTCLLMLRALKRHFTDHAIILNRINGLFGVYDRGAFIAGDTLFLRKVAWVRFGEKGLEEPIFTSAYLSLGIVYVFALCAVWAGA
jgi:hypothetical protein